MSMLFFNYFLRRAGNIYQQHDYQFFSNKKKFKDFSGVILTPKPNQAKVEL